MLPLEFKTRFVELLLPVPPDLNLKLDRFVTYPAERVALLSIPNAHKAYLLESGLPADAAPFLSFENHTDYSLTAPPDFPDSVIIGSNGYGDDICIDMAAGGAVVYYNHDDSMNRVFMNSSLPLFAECLCEYSLLRQTKDSRAFENNVNSIDPPALAPTAFWPLELADFVA